MLYIIDISEPTVLTQAEYEEISYTTFQTQFLLYTRNNRKVGEPLIINDNDSVKKSSWNPTHPTRIITHGWRGDIEDKSACALIRDAYLSIGHYNVILIDWSKAAGYLWYWKVARSVPLVAERVTQLIDFLQSQAGLDPSKTKVIGHSLGGHVVGLAARNANGNIAEAVALDPAKPLFDSKGPGERVDRSDAARVQVIHTSILGLGEPIGNADFYPNGGKSQPGCGIIALTCAHARSYEYYAESILNPTGFRAGNVFMGGPSLDPKYLLLAVYPSLLTIATNLNYTNDINDSGPLTLSDINESEFILINIFNTIYKDAKKTTFHLYTRNNPEIGQQLFIDDLDSIKKSFWNPDHPTRLITHGWKGNCETTICTDIRDDFLENNASLDPDRTTIIGYSLGGHIASLSARFATDKIREVVGKSNDEAFDSLFSYLLILNFSFTALNPAGPCFEYKELGERVDKTDAILVQVIHTCIKYMGIKSAIGTSDFYVNGGEEQPGCGRIRWIVYPSLLASIATNLNYTIVIDDHGIPNLIDTNEPKFTQADFKKIDESVQKTTFYLYTRNNPEIGQQLIIDDMDSVKKSFWNPNHPTRFVTHGWHGNCDGGCTQIRDAFLNVGDYNIILIDWRDAANHLYAISVKSAPLVSQRVAFLINFLEKNANLDPNKTAIIGHSLGAHVASLSARFATSKIAEVIALDPAAPLFETNGPGERVDKSDAILVQVIHTCTKFVGIKSAIGTSDFYPNGGEEQPGCGPIKWIGDVEAMRCAHSRSEMYYIESITNPTGFRARDVFMGGPSIDRNANGTYTLKTASESPFALG
ncbi:LIPP lipase, partial [Acromyrmex charruanus]